MIDKEFSYKEIAGIIGRSVSGLYDKVRRMKIEGLLL